MTNDNLIKKKNYIKPIFLIICIIIAFCIYSAYNEKWLWKPTFLEKNPIYNSNQMVKDGTSYTIDNFVITLEKYMYNQTSDRGHIVFSVKKKSFETKKDKKNWIANAETIFKERFSFAEFRLLDCHYELDGTTLYIYDDIEQLYFEDTFTIEPIILEDLFQPIDDEDSILNKHREYIFNLKSNVTTRAYKIRKDRVLYLSPSSVIYSNNDYDKNDEAYDEFSESIESGPSFKVVVYYKDGTKRKIIDTADKDNFSKYAFHRSHSDGNYHTNEHVFRHALRVNDIDYIKVNDKKYSTYTIK